MKRAVFHIDAAGAFWRVVGVALLALRAALRTKGVAALFALLMVCVLVLPRVVKGDGTPEGDLHILLSYTLGFSFGILCLATLWAACALFAAEIDSTRMQLSAVKPVRAAEFWIGKWLALLVLNAALLATVYAGVYAQLRWRVHQGGAAVAECLLSRCVTHPILPTVQEEARQAYETLQKQNALPKDLDKQATLQVLEEKASERYDVINPGDLMRWRFRLSRPVEQAEPVTVRVRFDTEYSTRELVKGSFRLSVAGDPAQAVEVKLDDFTQNEIEFVVDTQAFAGTRPKEGGLRDFELLFRHVGDPKKTSALMLRNRQDVVLLTPGGTFGANLVRAAVIHWSVLALLAAFGLTLSVCFSMPVAVFTATILLMLMLVGNSVFRQVSTEDEKKWQNRPGIFVSQVVHRISSRALKAKPLVALSNGERIDGETLGTSLAWNVGWAPLFFIFIGCAVLRRRELAQGD